MFLLDVFNADSHVPRAAEARLIVLIQLFGERGLVAVLIGESER